MASSSAMHFAPADVPSAPHHPRVTKDPGIIKVNNETAATSSRITRGGRRITYRARIIQQPNRARACGSGAKSCADRRPVDPPPIIELKIFEGPQDNEVDITYEYNANFFVFATLEHARHMATGRMPSTAQNNVPVLTGSPVAGMALLERPQKAGYFIFPDLSVRHEGKYRLNFSLYEELKKVEDMDSEVPEHTGGADKPAHVSHRLEVKTVPFTVFSAKKFPGLTLSTDLSITFAEQGCRVRIRRDVRMRNRRTKNGPMDMDTDPYYEPRRVSATPDASYHGPSSVSASRPPSVDHADRPRSSSVHSMANGHVRRLSGEQVPYSQNPYAASPQTTQGMYPPHAAWSQPAPDSHGYAPPQQAQPHHPYAPHSQYPAAAPPAQAMAPPPYAYNQNHAPAYAAEAVHSRQNSVDYSHSPRSATSPQMQQPPQHNSPYAAHAGAAYSGPRGFAQPVPPQPAHHASRVDSVHQASINSPQDHSYARLPAQTNGVKRDYGSSFDTQAIEQPLRHGARPTSNGLDPKFSFSMEASPAGASDDEGLDMSAMSYRRADGSYSRRRVPPPE